MSTTISIIILVVAIIFFFAIRDLIRWYFRINTIVELHEKQLKSSERINDKLEKLLDKLKSPDDPDLY
jgi:hypothetical protein